MPRHERKTRVRGGMRKNTRIGPVLLKFKFHLFQDSTVSWVRILKGVDKYATESMLTKGEEDIASGTPIA